MAKQPAEPKEAQFKIPDSLIKAIAPVQDAFGEWWATYSPETKLTELKAACKDIDQIGKLAGPRAVLSMFKTQFVDKLDATAVVAYEKIGNGALAEHKKTITQTKQKPQKTTEKEFSMWQKAVEDLLSSIEFEKPRNRMRSRFIAFEEAMRTQADAYDSFLKAFSSLDDDSRLDHANSFFTANDPAGRRLQLFIENAISAQTEKEG